MAQIIFKHVSRGFRRPGGSTVQALAEVGFCVENGELVVLAGPSGCGKTTALRVIAGLEEPDSGEIWIGGRSVLGVPPHEREVAMVFQDCALYPHMTVRENLNFGLRVRRVSGADAVRRIGDIAARLEISDWLDRWPEELSGGQKHRVALGRALVRQPRVLLLDEPLAGLDEPSRLKLRREIQRLHAENHFTMIYVTHDQAEAMALGERIILLENGRVQQSGKPVELFERPANRFVASFFGAPPMNFLPGEYRSAGGQCSFSVASANGSFGSTSAAPASDGEIVLPLTHGPLDHLPGTSGPIWCGFRPEDLTMANAPTQMSSEKVWILPCRVIAVERIGRVNWVHGSCGGHPLVALWEGGMIAAPGEELTLNLEISKANWFEVATGARLCG